MAIKPCSHTFLLWSSNRVLDESSFMTRPWMHILDVSYCALVYLWVGVKKSLFTSFSCKKRKVVCDVPQTTSVQALSIYHWSIPPTHPPLWATGLNRHILWQVFIKFLFFSQNTSSWTLTCWLCCKFQLNSKARSADFISYYKLMYVALLG